LPALLARRNDDMIEALKIMASEVGDEPMNGFAFSPSEPRFQQLLATTWNELEGRGLIEERGEKPGPTFRLTPGGWLGGLRILGGLDDPQTLARAVTIRKALKARIKGRQAYDGSAVDVRDLAQEINLPVGWLWNSMRANLLSELFPNHTMNASLDRSGVLVRIPPTFDMEELD
jgi:hypothetical protein